MQIQATPSLRLVFDREARLIEELASRRREEARHNAFADMEWDETRRKKEREEQRKHDAAWQDLMWAAMLASREEIADFTTKLDRYDAATVEALQENERASCVVRKRIDAALAGAVQLPDGRHVFKTADGTRVFDEHGKAVSSHDIRPEDIPDSRPPFESYQADRQSHDALAKEREELLAFQSRLDTTREKLDRKDLTREELKALDKDIDAAMPLQVRKEIENASGHAGPDPERGSSPQRNDPGDDVKTAPLAMAAAPSPGMN